MSGLPALPRRPPACQCTCRAATVHSRHFLYASFLKVVLVPVVSLVMLIIFPLASVVYCFLLGDCVKITVFIPLVQNCCKVVLQLEEVLPNGLFTASNKILLAVRTPLPISIALPGKCFSATTEGITSAAVANRKLLSLVK